MSALFVVTLSSFYEGTAALLKISIIIGLDEMSEVKLLM